MDWSLPTLKTWKKASCDVSEGQGFSVFVSHEKHFGKVLAKRPRKTIQYSHLYVNLEQSDSQKQRGERCLPEGCVCVCVRMLVQCFSETEGMSLAQRGDHGGILHVSDC